MLQDLKKGYYNIFVRRSQHISSFLTNLALGIQPELVRTYMSISKTLYCLVFLSRRTAQSLSDMQVE